jgi:segregation and condensation protein B
LEEVKSMAEHVRRNDAAHSGESAPGNSSPSDSGISLDQLSAAFAQMLGEGDDPYAAEGETVNPADVQLGGFSVDPAEIAEARAACEVTPRSILEAMLFVGSPGNEPLSSERVAALMRGVSTAEIDSLIAELNDQYTALHAPYEIIDSGPGYRLTLRKAFEPVQQQLYGKARQARLSQAAIEVLSIVAYNQPVSAEDVQRLRGMPSGSLLNQLVRRQLLAIERLTESKTVMYRTTGRFLQLFGLSTLADLPRSKELEG